MTDYKSRRQLPGLGGILKHPASYTRRLRDRIADRASDAAGKFEVAAFIGAAGVLVLALLLFVWMLVSVPDVQQLDRSSFARATVVYTDDGEELTRYYHENRSWVPLDSISPIAVEALVATEDRRFYDHAGVDVTRTAGALLETLQGEPQGGSTLTMQLARNAFAEVGDDFIVERKVKEWLTAIKVERSYSKDEILEMYLNTIPFNYNAFGIEAASRTYFNKPAAELDTLQAATLVGMLKGTSIYNPVKNPVASETRRNVVLKQMMENGVIGRSDYDRLREQETQLDFHRLTPTNNLAPYFADYVREWLDDWAQRNGFNLYTGGLRVYTTLDAELQREAEEAVRTQLERMQAVVDVTWSSENVPLVNASASAFENIRRQVDPFSYYWEAHPEMSEEIIQQSSRYRALTEQGMSPDEAMRRLSSDEAFVDSLKSIYSTLQAGLVAMNPDDGHVKAWVGGRRFDKYQFDHVVDARRQPGSTFKPFVYAAALKKGISPLDTLRDKSIRYVDEWTGREWSPENFGRETGRMLTVREGLAQSKNTITSRLMMEVGPEAVVDMARTMGIKSELDAVPSLALGTSEVTLLELTAAYATLANAGVYNEPLTVTRIETADGRVLATFSSESRRAIEPEIAYGVLDMMRGVIDHGTGVRMKRVYGARGDVAGKTGTTQRGADGWFMLIHPELVAGSWVGFPSPSITFRTRYWGQGSHNALRIVGDFYRDAGLSTGAQFHPPAGYTPPEERRLRRRAEDTAGFQLPDFDFTSDDEDDESRPDGIDTTGFDTTGFAVTDQDRDTAAVAGSLGEDRSADVGETDTTVAEIEESEEGSAGADEDASAAENAASREENDAAVAADSETERLNRQEMEESNVDEYLERLEEEREGDNQ